MPWVGGDPGAGAESGSPFGLPIARVATKDRALGRFWRLTGRSAGARSSAAARIPAMTNRISLQLPLVGA